MRAHEARKHLVLEDLRLPPRFTVDLLQPKDLLKIHRAFHHTLTRFTVRHGGSIAI